MPDRRLDEEEIFHVARKITDPETQAKYLDQICAGDLPLRKRVEALLKVHEQPEGFLTPEAEPGATVDQPSIAEMPGHEIGRYKLLQKIGEGGFGVVYMAEQQRPVHRRVALKIIKPGMDTHAVVARFEAERQALALMDHPNIARVFDGGATENGRPYFVMELVKGVPITEYCDKNQLPAEERLKLFITVCQAVQHAHQKGIIHRDLKPSNILVTLHDGVPVVKVIDFGVAKAVNQRLTEKTLFTSYGQMIGTPQYMSPEQAEMSGLDVDTRSDIYSLGVLLYELLTGTTPLESDRLRTAGYAEMQRMIREDEPPKPSTRLSTAGDKLTVIAKARSVSPDRLPALVRGDLDWIALKALDKDRGRRYDTAAGLAQDIERHLDNEPVSAHANSLAYRAHKFIRKYRRSIATAAVLVGAMLVGLVSSCMFALWALHERDNARESAAEAQTVQVRWREELLDRAFSAALAGDTVEVDNLFSRAPLGELEEYVVETIQGVACAFNGDDMRASELLRKALARKPDSLAALCGATLVGFSDSTLEDMFVLQERIASIASRADISDHERLMLAQLGFAGTMNLPRLITDLDGIILRHPRWGMAYAFRAEAKAQLAQGTHSMETLEEAISDTEQARIYVPRNPFILGVSIDVYCYAIELARFQGQDTAELEREGNEIAAALDNWPLYERSRGSRAVYYFIVKAKEKYQADYEQLMEWVARPSLSQFQLARLLQQDDPAELFNVAKQHPSLTTPGLAAAIRHILDGHTETGLTMIEQLEKGPAPTNTRVLMLDALCIAERPDLARAFADRILKRLPPHDPPSTWRMEVWEAKYMAGQISEQEFLRLAGPFHFESTAAHWTIGMMALAHGDVTKSREHLQIAAQCATPGLWHNEFSKAYLNLIDRGRLPASKLINPNTRDK